jgi:hypothetical protein
VQHSFPLKLPFSNWLDMLSNEYLLAIGLIMFSYLLDIFFLPFMFFCSVAQRTQTFSHMAVCFYLFILLWVLGIFSYLLLL